MQLIDGKAISELVKQEIAAEVAEIVAKGGKRPHLAAILVGHDGGSETYVAAKVKASFACGLIISQIRICPAYLPSTATWTMVPTLWQSI